MNKVEMHRTVLACIIGSALLASLPAVAASECFTSSKIYRIHPMHGGTDIKDGWGVKADAFNRCVHRAEAADKSLRAHYPDTVYELSLAATIGCHSPCDG
jgi:hypothetical protein